MSDLSGVESALESIKVPAYVVDESGVIRWVNPAARHVLGNVVGRQGSSVVAAIERPRARELFQRKILGREDATDVDAHLIGATGELLHVEISSAALRRGGSVVGVFGLFRVVPPAAPRPNPHLTPRQNDVLHLIDRGHKTQQIADDLHLTRKSVQRHVNGILRAYGVRSRIELLLVRHAGGVT